MLHLSLALLLSVKKSQQLDRYSQNIKKLIKSFEAVLLNVEDQTEEEDIQDSTD